VEHALSESKGGGSSRISLTLNPGYRIYEPNNTAIDARLTTPVGFLQRFGIF
jgi:hypothetical protein